MPLRGTALRAVVIRIGYATNTVNSLMLNIQIRPLEPGDAEFYAAIQNDPDVRKHIGPALNLNAEECRKAIETGTGALSSLYIIGDIEEGHPIGICGFTPNNNFEGTDVLVQILSNHQNSGIGTHVLSELMEMWFGKERNDVLFASVSPRNRPAIALLRNAGFCFDEEYEDIHGAIHHKYSIQRDGTST